MNFIMIPLVTGIVTLGIYKFFELLICRRERREIIGKLEPGSLIDYLKLVPMGLRTGRHDTDCVRNCSGYPGRGVESRLLAAGAGRRAAFRLYADPDTRNPVL